MSVITTRIVAAIRDLFLFALVSGVQTYLMCPRCTREEYIYILAFTFAMWVALWKGNSLVSMHLSRKISWIEHPTKRFVAGIVLNIGYTVAAVLLLIQVFERISPIRLGDASRYTIYGAIIFTIFISFFLHARHFLIYWRKASFEKEQYEKESIIAKYESLKSQVSPHFLFNSLNALTNLVYEDPDKAVKFIKQLSDVYRYVLDTRDREVVSVADELQFLDAYLYLQRIRFEGKLIVNIDPIPGGKQIPPLALQMLIENVIKHNIISEEHPLAIRLYSEDGFLIVENNLQPKSEVNDSASSHVGLDNIRRRYEFLTDKKVSIVANDQAFTVKLPLLNG